MPVVDNEIELRYSGGAANAVTLSSLGGVKSSVLVVSQNTTIAVQNITGVTIVDAIGNALGNGTLTSDGTNLTWAEVGGIAGAPVNVSVNGRYTIVSAGTGVVIVDVLNLGAGALTDTVTIADNKNNLFDDVLASESVTGKIEYRCMYVHNASAINMLGCVIWINAITPGPDDMQLMVDAAGAGNGSTTGVAQVIATEATQPTGAFSAPQTSAVGLSLGAINAGQSAAFWVRRHVPANTTVAQLANTSVIGIQVQS